MGMSYGVPALRAFALSVTPSPPHPYPVPVCFAGFTLFSRAAHGPVVMSGGLAYVVLVLPASLDFLVVYSSDSCIYVYLLCTYTAHILIAYIYCVHIYVYILIACRRRAIECM